MNLLTPEEIAEANQGMLDIFDTFAREHMIRFYKAAKQAEVINVNFSKRWEESYNNIPKTPEYMDFKCRVFGNERNPFDEIMLGSDKDIRYKGQYNRIKIHVLPEAYQYLQKTERFVWEGITYKRDSGDRPLGILAQINVYEINLEQVN